MNSTIEEEEEEIFSDSYDTFENEIEMVRSSKIPSLMIQSLSSI